MLEHVAPLARLAAARVSLSASRRFSTSRSPSQLCHARAGLAGLRLGYGIAHPELQRVMMAIKQVPAEGLPHEPGVASNLPSMSGPTRTTLSYPTALQREHRSRGGRPGRR